MTTNIIFVAAGQCGNQLCYELINHLYSHASDRKYMPNGSSNAVQSKMETMSRNRLIDSVFNTNSCLDYENIDQSHLSARVVGLDTEPKVLEDCIANTQRNKHWQYDVQSIAYRHGGAGNNWALGYEMASGEYLDVSLNCIRRQVERSDRGQMLCFMHSLAGGTGSGLGTRVTEACADEFSELFRMNFSIAPYHFGEVVVQYYNALLCLSKVASHSHATLVFENEVASQLCKDMLRIEKPLLKDLNYSIASNLVSLFLPKLPSSAPCSAHPFHLNSLSDDVAYLTTQSAYPFLNVKLTPQTSSKSIDFTYDSYTSLLKTVQRLALSGTQIERLISREIKNAGNVYTNLATGPSDVVKSIGSVLTCHGEGSWDTVQTLQQTLIKERAEGDPGATSTVKTPPSKSRLSSQSTPPQNNLDTAFLPQFLSAHVTRPDMLFSFPSSSCPVQMYSSVFALNKYQRSCTLLCNDQSILSILNRPYHRAQELFRMKAYLHQYETYNIHQEDFVQSFQEMSAYILNYSNL